MLFNVSGVIDPEGFFTNMHQSHLKTHDWGYGRLMMGGVGRLVIGGHGRPVIGRQVQILKQGLRVEEVEGNPGIGQVRKLTLVIARKAAHLTVDVIPESEKG